MALRVFTSARAALEVTRGTDLTPTRIIYGEEFTHEQDKQTIRPATLNNSYEGFRDASAGVETNTLAVSGRMSYDDLIWWGNLFVAPLASGTGAGTDKTWAFVPSLTSDNVKTATVQLGYADTIATAPGVRLNYCLGNTFNLHFEKNDDGAVTFSGDFFIGAAATQITAFTGSLADRTVISMSSNNTQVYLDPTTIGSTVDNNVISVDWTLNLGPVAFYALDGTTAANAVYRPNHRTWTATITRRYANDAEWDRYVDKAERKVRVLTTSSTIIAGSAVPYSATLDLYGAYTGRTWAEVDGIITEELTLEPFYDVSAARSFGLTVVNATGTIT
jgi:hypothetical protein